MDVFVTGATGVLGRATVPLLAAAGDRVRALSRSEKNDETLRCMGAEPVRGDLFDRDSVRAAVTGSDAILHLATKIPAMRRAIRAGAWQENDRIREDGTHNLVDAALAAGVETFIYPSVIFVYPDGGDRWLDAATTQPVVPPSNILRSTLIAEAEVARFSADGHRGVVLRMGAFYGPESVQTRDLVDLARRGLAALLGSSEGYQSSIWIPDAAAAVVAALERAPAGIYDVVDDEPLRRRELKVALAAAVGRRRLLSLPAALVRVGGGKAGAALSVSQRVSNWRFREATGWAPTVPNARIGLGRLDAENRSGPSGSRGIRRWLRAGLGLLVLVSLPIGVWQQFAPRSFYDAFPGFVHAWVSGDGPYNKHLMRDVGGGSLGLAVVACFALARPSATLVRALATGMLVSQVPHIAYHAAHLDLLPTRGDQIAQSIALVLYVMLAALLFVSASRFQAEADAATGQRDPRQREAPGVTGPADSGAALGRG